MKRWRTVNTERQVRISARGGMRLSGMTWSGRCWPIVFLTSVLVPAARMVEVACSCGLAHFSESASKPPPWRTNIDK